MDWESSSPSDRVRAAARTVLESSAYSGDVRGQIEAAVESIARQADRVLDPAQAALLEATVTLLAASRASMQAIGECRRQQPFADVYVVLTDQGAQYCCTHNPSHCA
jgi:hypothetical protein